MTRYRIAILCLMVALTAPGIVRAAEPSDFGPPGTFTAAPPLLYDWSGPYAGLSVAGAWSAFDTSYGAPATAFSLRPDRFSLGAFAGLAAQIDSFVFGVEMDAAFFTGDETRTILGTPVTTQNDWVSTLRGRAGFAMDRYLLYGTAGAAVGDVGLSIPGQTSQSTRFGWAAGLGLEAAITDNFTARAEYLYTDLGTARGTLGGSPFTTEFDSHTVRAGVVYRFR